MANKPVPIKDDVARVPQHKRMAAGGKPNAPIPTKGPKTPA